MKKAGVILLSGLLACVAAFAVFYYTGTAPARQLLRQAEPELAWLKKEFGIGDSEFDRIVELHRAYLPKCAERCRLIEEQTAKLKELLAESPTVTPEMEAVMTLRAKMRADCEAEMLKHFIEVSRTMPADQGHRYLEWVEQQTIFRGEAMERQHHSNHEGHHH